MTAARVAAIVVAGGSGERLGREGGKQLAIVAGLPVLSWTLMALAKEPRIGLIVVVAHPDRVAKYRSTALDPLGLTVPAVVVAGGDSRQESVTAGLAAVPDWANVILVQDGARPLLTRELVAGALDALAEDPAAAGVVVGHPSIDTLKVAADRVVESTPERSRFWAVQTPQVFAADVLKHAYAQAAADGFIGTDDSSLVERAGGRVVLFEGPRDNIKVTVAEDLALVEAVLRSREGGYAL